MSNYITATLTKQQQDEILALLYQVDAKLSFNVNLTKEQLDAIPKLSDGRLPFTQKALSYGKQDTSLVPPYNDLVEYDNDLNFFTGIEPIESFILRLAEKVTTARAASGSDAYTTALSIYDSAQRASKQGHPGAKAIVDDLKSLFEHKAKTKPKA
jgi:hypothetical protein